MIRKLLFPLVLFSLLLTHPDLDANSTSRIPAFTLEDQYERLWSHSDFTSSLVVFVISDRDGYEYSTNWTAPLIREYGKRVRFVPIADVRGVPGFLKGYIRGRFKGEFKYPILMDWEGTIANGIKFTPGYPNLLIVGSDRTIHFKAAGAGNEQQLKTFRIQLNKLLDATR